MSLPIITCSSRWDKFKLAMLSNKQTFWSKDFIIFTIIRIIFIHETNIFHRLSELFPKTKSYRINGKFYRFCLTNILNKQFFLNLSCERKSFHVEGDRFMSQRLWYKNASSCLLNIDWSTKEKNDLELDMKLIATK